MAWTPVSTLQPGESVETPQGNGKIRQVSEANKTAQVEVGGKLFEVPLEQIKQGGKQEPAKPVRSWRVRPGDRVQSKTGVRQGQVTEVTQRTVKGMWDDGRKFAVPKREVGDHLDEGQPKKDEQPKEQPEEKPEQKFKVGDRVEHEKYGQGTVRGISSSSIGVEFDESNSLFHSLEGKAKDGHGYWCSDSRLTKVEDTPKQPEQPEQPEDKVKSTGDGLHDLLKLKEYLESKIDKSVDDELKELKELAKKNQKLEVKIGEKSNVIAGLKHKQLEQLIAYAAMRLSPLLVGMAGTGKTHAGQQTAEALGLPFYSMSVGAQTSKSDIIGYMDASGKYVRTHFRDAYQNGGVFLMDEIDAGNANVLIQINAALSNGLCAFPDAMVERHADFVFIASANTFGNGANRQYVGRNQLDAATLDRFAVIEWFIDDELESQLAVGLNGKAWYMAVRAARDYVAEKSIRALISPRATQKGSRLLDVGQDLQEVIHATMLGSVPDDKKQDVIQVATTIFNKFASQVPSGLSKSVNPEVSELLR